MPLHYSKKPVPLPLARTRVYGRTYLLFAYPGIIYSSNNGMHVSVGANHTHIDYLAHLIANIGSSTPYLRRLVPRCFLPAILSVFCLFHLFSSEILDCNKNTTFTCTFCEYLPHQLMLYKISVNIVLTNLLFGKFQQIRQLFIFSYFFI